MSGLMALHSNRWHLYLSLTTRLSECVIAAFNAHGFGSAAARAARSHPTALVSTLVCSPNLSRRRPGTLEQRHMRRRFAARLGRPCLALIRDIHQRLKRCDMYGGEPVLPLMFYHINAACRMFLAVAFIVATACLSGAHGSTTDCILAQLK